MPTQRELYQQMILDHNKNPRNFKELDAPTHVAEGYNPLCGDQVKLYLRIVDGVIQEVGFQGAGCAISTASASLLTEHILGCSPSEANALFETFVEMLHPTSMNDARAALGDLAVFEGVRDYPTRIKCATLCWHTLKAALDGRDPKTPVSTESPTSA